MSDKVSQNEIGSLSQEQIVAWLRRWLERNGSGVTAEELNDSGKEKREESPRS